MKLGAWSVSWSWSKIPIQGIFKPDLSDPAEMLILVIFGEFSIKAQIF